MRKTVEIISGIYIMIFGMLAFLYLLKSYNVQKEICPEWVLNWTLVCLPFMTLLGFMLIVEAILRK